MNTRKEIEKFLEPKKMAIAGVSRNPKKFGHIVFAELKKKNYQLYPVNPQASDIEGEKCYSSVNELPADVKRLLMITPKNETDKVLREAIRHGITNIWVQQSSETKDTVRIASEGQVEIIARKCILLFAEPVTGIHKFHLTLARLFGAMPK